MSFNGTFPVGDHAVVVVRANRLWVTADGTNITPGGFVTNGEVEKPLCIMSYGKPTTTPSSHKGLWTCVNSHGYWGALYVLPDPDGEGLCHVAFDDLNTPTIEVHVEADQPPIVEVRSDGVTTFRHLAGAAVGE